MSALQRSAFSTLSTVLSSNFPSTHLRPKRRGRVDQSSSASKIFTFMKKRQHYLACGCCHPPPQLQPLCNRECQLLVLSTLWTNPILNNFLTPIFNFSRQAKNSHRSFAPSCFVLVRKSALKRFDVGHQLCYSFSCAFLKLLSQTTARRNHLALSLFPSFCDRQLQALLLEPLFLIDFKTLSARLANSLFRHGKLIHKKFHTGSSSSPNSSSPPPLYHHLIWPLNLHRDSQSILFRAQGSWDPFARLECRNSSTPIIFSSPVGIGSVPHHSLRTCQIVCAVRIMS